MTATIRQLCNAGRMEENSAKLKEFHLKTIKQRDVYSPFTLQDQQRRESGGPRAGGTGPRSWTEARPRPPARSAAPLGRRQRTTSDLGFRGEGGGERWQALPCRGTQATHKPAGVHPSLHTARPPPPRRPPQWRAVLCGYHGNPALAHRHHPRFAAYIRAHSRCCAVSGFWRTWTHYSRITQSCFSALRTPYAPPSRRVCEFWKRWKKKYSERT